MPTCSICMQDRQRLKFRTGRIAICQWCVHSLNHTPLSPREAGPRYVAKFRESIIARNPVAATWNPDWFADRLDTHLLDPNRARRSIELRILRAYRRGLVCLDRRFLDYPPDWPRKRYIIKHRDDYACHVCGDVGAEIALHVHHIIHRSNSGTNGRANLVTLCLKHHQLQHPGITLGVGFGEGMGMDDDPMADDEDWREDEEALFRDELLEAWEQAVDGRPPPDIAAAAEHRATRATCAREPVESPPAQPTQKPAPPPPVANTIVPIQPGFIARHPFLVFFAIVLAIAAAIGNSGNGNKRSPIEQRAVENLRMQLADPGQNRAIWAAHGTPCRSDCSGHAAGYAWAARRSASPADCNSVGGNRSFREGCMVWAEQTLGNP